MDATDYRIENVEAAEAIAAARTAANEAVDADEAALGGVADARANYACAEAAAAAAYDAVVVAGTALARANYERGRSKAAARAATAAFWAVIQ